MLIKILHRFTEAVLFEHDCDRNSMRLTLELAANSSANLRGADLRDANLGGADLRDAYLRDANLGGADLRDANLRDAYLCDAYLGGADLRDANLRGADLRDADLRDANLGGADLRDANLGGADLRGAYLGGADLRGAYLGGADLCGADLRHVKADFIEIIAQAPMEIPALIAALKDGRVDGSTYAGECACLVGTIANARGIAVHSEEFKIPMDSSRPAENFFMTIRKGDTPETNPASALALEWAEQFYKTMVEAFGRNFVDDSVGG